MKRLFVLGQKIYSDSLFQNSFYLILSTFIVSLSGFLFWIISARFYSTYDVGIATALIVSVSQLATYSILGLNNGIIKYLPLSKKPNIETNSLIFVTIIFSLIASLIYLLFLPKISLELTFIRNNFYFSLIFILGLIISSLNIAIESIYIAYRNSKMVFFKNAIWSTLRLILPIIFLGFGAISIFGAYIFSLTITVIIFIYIGYKLFKINFQFVINFIEIKKLISFSFITYIANLISAIPFLVLPIMITNNLGAEFTAYYYISLMIANFLYIAIQSTTRSLFAEASYSKEKLKKNIIKACGLILLLVSVGIVGVMLLGDYVLFAFGKEYINNASDFLKLLTFSALFFSIISICNTIFMVINSIKKIILINLLWVITLMISYNFFIQYGLVGIGISWLISQIITALIALLLLFQHFSFINLFPQKFVNLFNYFRIIIRKLSSE